jgi:hypothetical protein
VAHGRTVSTKDGSVALDQHIRELWHFILIGMFKPLNSGTLSCWAKHAKHGLSWGRAMIFKSLSSLDYEHAKLPIQVGSSGRSAGRQACVEILTFMAGPVGRQDGRFIEK